MQLSKMKNIIVLRGMASNVVDEAIVVLKPHVKLKQNEYNSKGKQDVEEKNKKMIVLKEAENTINNYVKKIQKDSKGYENVNFKKKYRFLQVSNIIMIFCIVVGALISF